MCLNQITTKRHITEKDIITYKLIINYPGDEPHFQYADDRMPQERIKLLFDRPLHAIETRIKVNDGYLKFPLYNQQKTYISGFHCFVNREDAELMQHDNSPDKTTLVKVTIPAGSKIQEGTQLLWRRERCITFSPRIIVSSDVIIHTPDTGKKETP